MRWPAAPTTFIAAAAAEVLWLAVLAWMAIR
jgi:hypothetical protein